MTGDVRLADSAEDRVQNTMRGTLQICINNAWGAVCSDLFDVRDARVACQQAGGYGREVVGVIEAVSIVGPEFVSDLGCDGDEASLLECRRFNSHVGAVCDSGNNAVITCRGQLCTCVHIHIFPVE